MALASAGYHHIECCVAEPFRALDLVHRGGLFVWKKGLVRSSGSLMRQTRVQYSGARLGGQAGHYPSPAVKGMSYGVVREDSLFVGKNFFCFLHLVAKCKNLAALIATTGLIGLTGLTGLTALDGKDPDD